MAQMKEQRVKIDRKLFTIKGINDLAQCLKHEEQDGFELDRVIWIGNLEVPNVPGQILTDKGQQTKTGLVHLFLVMFVRKTPLQGPARVM